MPPPSPWPRPARWRRWLDACWRPETGIFLGFWLLLLFRGRSSLFKDQGTFWHVVSGERMLTTGRLYAVDPFSFTHAGQPWVPFQWLAECGMAGLHRIDGLSTLLLGAMAMVAGLFAWLYQRTIRGGLHRSVAILFVGLALAAGSMHFLVRPHLFTMVGMGATMAFLCSFEAGRIGLGRLCWLVPIFVVWTNLHAGELGGMGTLALAWAGWAIFGLLGGPSPLRGWRQTLRAGGVVLICGLAMFVNPYGVGLLDTWWRIVADPHLKQLASEHAPLRWGEPYTWPALLFGALYAGLLLSVRPFQPRVTWLLPLVWLVLGIDRMRQLPLFAVTATVAIVDLLPHTALGRWLTRKDWLQPQDGEAWRRSAPGLTPWLIPIAAVLIALALQAGRARVPLVGHDWARLDRAYWPVEMLPTLREYERMRPDGTPIFNECLYGGFLIYHTPGYRVFGDDRCELYGGAWLKVYVDGEKALDERQIPEWEAQYGRFDFALTQVGSAYDAYFRRHPEAWEVFRQAGEATFFRRRMPT